MTATDRPGFSRRQLLRTAMLAAVPATAGATAVSSSAPADRAEAKQLHALFQRSWDRSAELFPEWATFRGDHRFGDRWMDGSPAGRIRIDAWPREMLDAAKGIRRDALAAVDKVSLDLFVDGHQRQVDMQRFDGYRRLRLGSAFGFQSLLAGVLRAAPVHGAEQIEQMLERMAAYPRRVDEEIEFVRGGLALGWVSPRDVLERTLRQIDDQLVEAEKGPFFEPLAKIPTSLPGRDALVARGLALIRAQLLPAQRKLRQFVAETLLPAAPADGGLLRYPDGEAVYVALVREHTTLALAPQEVHDTGLRELQRLRAQMAQVQREMKFDGDFAAFVAYLKQPERFYPSPEALLEGYRATAKRLDPEMPQLFAELPRAPYGIRPMPAFLGAGAADNYNGPSPDGSRPGWYNANIHAYKRRPRWALPTLVAHETVPGHHLQSGRAVELRDLPAFRRQTGYTVYNEGWALYAETLARDVGVFDTPESLFGHLQAQAFRAARLVVDTGLHALGWTREQAVDFMVTQVGESRVFIDDEVARYLSIPGQALAYMVGRLKIEQLRDEARARLGTRFDLRRFHNVLLDQGSLPLEVLAAQVATWVEAEAARA